jgi:ferredoxin
MPQLGVLLVGQDLGFGLGRLKKLATIFSNPLLPKIGDYYEPWTYDYENLTTAPAQRNIPVARPKSLLTGRDMKVAWSANWDDGLGGSPDLLANDPILAQVSAKVRLDFERTFLFYLPRICEHCLNPSCAASCPSGAIYKRAEDGIVLVDQDLAAFDPRLERRQDLGVVVFADAGVDAIVPVMQAADQVFAVDETVREQRAAMQAAPVEHEDRVGAADDHEVHIGDQRIGRRAIGKLRPVGYHDLVHKCPLNRGVTFGVRAE